MEKRFFVVILRYIVPLDIIDAHRPSHIAFLDKYYADGIYFDSLMNKVGCDSVLTTNLKLIMPLYYNNSVEICPGDTFRISSHYYVSTGTYSDTFKNFRGCDSIILTHLKVLDMPVLKIPADTFLCEAFQDTIILHAGQHLNYFWQPNGEITESIVVSKPGVYSINVKDNNNCVATGTVLVNDICPPTLFIPNAFSPDGNELNDYFNPVTTFLVEFHMTIYNKWGEVIFVTDALSPGWDGRYKGKDANEDVYIYIIEAKGIDNRRYHRKGTFHLLR